jgi:hypothetical protein
MDHDLLEGCQLEADDLQPSAYIWVLLELVFDEPQEMFLVHTRRMVDVGIDLSDIIEVTECQLEDCYLDHDVPMRNSLSS